MNDNKYLFVTSFCKDEIKIVVQRGKQDSVKGIFQIELSIHV